MDWLLGLWEKNKILFFLLLIPIVIAFVLKFYQEYQYQMAKKSLEDMKKESAERKKKIAKQEKLAGKAMELADAAAKRRKERKEKKQVGLDWYKDEQ